MKQNGKMACVFAVCAAALICASCTSFKAEGLSFVEPDSSVKILGSFDVTRKITGFLGEPAGINFADGSATKMNGVVSEMIWDEIHRLGGNAAQNISIRYFASTGDCFANLFTCGICAPARLQITGDVILTTAAAARAEKDKVIGDAVAKSK